VERYALLTLAGASVLAPWVPSFPLVGGLLMAVLMAVAFTALVRAIVRGRVAREEGRLLLAVAAAFLAMTVAGLAVAVTGGSVASVLGFGTVMGTIMGVEAAYLIRRYYQGRMARPWLARPVDEDDAKVAGRTYPETPARDPRRGERPVVDP